MRRQERWRARRARRVGVREVEGGEKGDGEGEGVGEGEEERKGKGGRLKWRKDGCRKGGVCVCWGGG